MATHYAYPGMGYDEVFGGSASLLVANIQRKGGAAELDFYAGEMQYAATHRNFARAGLLYFSRVGSSLFILQSKELNPSLRGSVAIIVCCCLLRGTIVNRTK